MNIYPTIKGSIESWDVLVIGHLKANRFFGESFDAPPRGDPSTCTSVIIRGTDEKAGKYCLIIDPTLRVSPEDFYFDLNRRTGLRPADVTHVFASHHHADHWQGLSYFPNAVWCTAGDNRRLITDSAPEEYQRLVTVEGEFLSGVYAVPLPGHTAWLHGVAFRDGKRKVIIAADAVMTQGHFANRYIEFQPDAALENTGKEIIDSLQESFDIIVMGHDGLIIKQ